jgi:hypothetical protein
MRNRGDRGLRITSVTTNRVETGCRVNASKRDRPGSCKLNARIESPRHVDSQKLIGHATIGIVPGFRKPGLPQANFQRRLPIVQLVGRSANRTGVTCKTEAIAGCESPPSLPTRSDYQSRRQLDKHGARARRSEPMRRRCTESDSCSSKTDKSPCHRDFPTRQRTSLSTSRSMCTPLALPRPICQHRRRSALWHSLASPQL